MLRPWHRHCVCPQRFVGWNRYYSRNGGQKSNVTIGRTMLYVDMCIILPHSLILFGQVDKVVYGFVVLVIMSYVCDMVINTNRQAVQFTIISSHWDEIAAAINNDAKRGCTVLDGTGWYTRQSVKILLVFCRKIEAITIFRIVKSIDPEAFISGNVNGVYGRGFDTIKLKAKPSRPKPVLKNRLTRAPHRQTLPCDSLNAPLWPTTTSSGAWTIIAPANSPPPGANISPYRQPPPAPMLQQHSEGSRVLIRCHSTSSSPRASALATMLASAGCRVAFTDTDSHGGTLLARSTGAMPPHRHGRRGGIGALVAHRAPLGRY